ncbi:codeine O-demethylase-like [Impatiens glandulifera]|uniref:codeine O-demethylase-like n=1 Tax=Impatiens glandulifera TaxID=253017 RepID=UPI001FB08505|nr:codeine O-demethylase-like [Impatiens glandulifera]
MAEISELPSPKPVQELLKEDNHATLERYIYKDTSSTESQYGAIDSSVPIADIPVIDLINLLSSETEKELANFKSALLSWGCFQVTNHGMTISFLNELRRVAKEFFQLPIDEKKKCNRAVGDIHGYGNDMVITDDQTLDWTDRLYLYLFPEDQRNLNLWPQIPESFREVLDEYAARMKDVYESVLRAIEKTLNLEEDCLLKMNGERGIIHARFNLYPPCPKPDLILGLKPHADGSAITVVLPDDEVEGLQFFKDGNWFRVHTVPHALLINVGDQIEILTNGIFKSPVHRVVANSDKERLTLAVFCAPDPEKEIEPLEVLVNEERPKAYKKVTNYPAIYFQYYQKGMRPIDSVKI